MSFKIVLPRGSHIEPQVLDVLARKGIGVTRPHPRSLRAHVQGLGFITRAQFCRSPSVIDLLVHGKSFVAGICGKDILLEHQPTTLDIYAEFTCSTHVRAVLFTRIENSVSTLREFIQEPDLTIYSEYPTLTGGFLLKNGKYGRVIGSKSPEEIVCGIKSCKYGVALVETGTTLAVNGLKEIEGGTIFESWPVLIGRKNGPNEAAARLAARLRD